MKSEILSKFEPKISNVRQSFNMKQEEYTMDPGYKNHFKNSNISSKTYTSKTVKYCQAVSKVYSYAMHTAFNL